MNAPPPESTAASAASVNGSASSPEVLPWVCPKNAIAAGSNAIAAPVGDVVALSVAARDPQRLDDVGRALQDSCRAPLAG